MEETQALAEAEVLLSNFGLKEDLWEAYPTTFSGSEQQKVNLARALVTPRRLLLLDDEVLLCADHQLPNGVVAGTEAKL